MSAKHYWADLTTREFEALDLQRTIAVLPVGAIEQHGPHLPVSVDRDIIDALVERTVALLDGLPVLFLPTMAIGKSNEHIAFPGTLTLCAETLMRVWMELGDSVARAGIRKLLIVNSHGGNAAAMDIVARDLRARHGMLTASCSCYRLQEADELYDARELEHGIHGGFGETSIMLHLRPALVDLDKAKDFVAATEQWSEQHRLLGAGARAAKLGWLIQDLNAEGACGNAAAADAAAGETFLSRGAEGLAALLRELDSLSAEGLDGYR